MTSILAAVDRDGRSKSVAMKAVELARLIGAHLELFLCDAERAYVRQHQYDREVAARATESCLADSHRYLESLWRELAVSDVEISSSVGCESPLYAGIVHAVERGHPGLVVRGVGTEAAVPFFWTQQYDVSIDYVGHAAEWDGIEQEGDPAFRDVLLRFRRNGRTLAVSTIFRGRDSLQAELVMEHVRSR